MRRMALVLVPLLLGALAGCSGLSTTGGAAVVKGQQTPVATAKAKSGSPQVATRTSTASARPEASASPRPVRAQAAPSTASPTPRCPSKSLTIARQEQRPNLGIQTPQESPVVGFQLTNRGSTTCTLSGWPDITLRGTDVVVTCNPADNSCRPGVQDKTTVRPVQVRRLPIDAEAITLKPKQWAMFAVVWSGNGVCWDGAYAMDARLPQDGTVLRVVEPGLCVRPMSLSPIMIPA